VCLNVKKLKVGLDQYGAERFRRLIFATIRTSVGPEELTAVTAVLVRRANLSG